MTIGKKTIMYKRLEQKEQDRKDLKKRISDIIEPAKPLQKTLRKLTNSIQQDRLIIKNLESKEKI